MRGNAGGYMPAGVEAAKVFLPPSAVVTTEVGRDGRRGPAAAARVLRPDPPAGGAAPAKEEAATLCAGGCNHCPCYPVT